MTWTLRAQVVSHDGTTKPYERTCKTKPVIQLWDGGRAKAAERDGTWARMWRCVDFIESEEIQRG